MAASQAAALAAFQAASPAASQATSPAASLAAFNSSSVASPFANRSATSSALTDRWSAIMCCTCLAHQTANNRISLSCPVTARRHHSASSSPLLSRIVIRLNGSSSAAVLPRFASNFFHPSAHGYLSRIAFSVVLMPPSFQFVVVVPQPRPLLQARQIQCAQSFRRHEVPG